MGWRDWKFPLEKESRTWEMLSLNQRYWLIKVKCSKFSILNTARGEKTQVVQYIGGASKKWKLKGFYWPICSSWKLLEMYKLDIQNWFVHSVCYTDSWSHERERERILLSLTGCSHRCRHQQVWIHSSLEVKPKQNWTPWYTEMPIPLTPHAPASHTNQSHRECEPPSKSESALLMKFNPFSQISELFREGNALEWMDSLQGVQPTTFWQCLWGKRGSPCVGLIPGGGTTQMCAQKPYKCPFLAITPLLPHRIIPN